MKSTDRYLPFGNARPNGNARLSPEMRECALKIYREAWDAYKKAGCPYGESDEAMLVWYSFREDSKEENVAIGRN